LKGTRPASPGHCEAIRRYQTVSWQSSGPWLPATASSKKKAWDVGMFIVFFFWEHHGMAVGISTTKNVFSFFFFKGVCVMTQWGLIGFYDDDDDGDDDVLIYTYVIL
jgi:hypothetical protein